MRRLATFGRVLMIRYSHLPITDFDVLIQFCRRLSLLMWNTHGTPATHKRRKTSLYHSCKFLQFLDCFNNFKFLNSKFSLKQSRHPLTQQLNFKILFYKYIGVSMYVQWYWCIIINMYMPMILIIIYNTTYGRNI